MTTLTPGSVGQPLFIVDRDWLRQGAKARKSWTGNVRNHSLYGLPIQVTQYNVPGSAARRKLQTKVRRRPCDKQVETTDSESLSEPERALSQEARPSPTQQPATTISNFVTSQRSDPFGDSVPTLNRTRSFQAWPEHPAGHPPISLGFPGLKGVRGLECYLDYYLDVIGTIQNPIEACIRLQAKAGQSSWCPLAFEDDAWLQNIVLFSALQHASNQELLPAQGASALMSSFLTQLNDRISRSELSDSTIASVSCLTLGEHIKGNHQIAKVHATGMAEMVRMRGGLYTIERARRSKIVRADIIRSADTLEPPMLPRLPREPLLPYGDDQTSPTKVASAIAKLSRAAMSPILISSIWTLRTICTSLDRAWAARCFLDATSYYEHVLCLNHDLLTYIPSSAFDQALKLSIINFTQPMFRYCAYTENSCERRVQRLKYALEQLYFEHYDQDLVLWMLFTGYMSSEHTCEHDWFKERLNNILRQIQSSIMRDWQVLKKRLQNFVWTDCLHDRLGKHFFDNLLDEERRVPLHLNNMCLTCSGKNPDHDLKTDIVKARNLSI